MRHTILRAKRKTYSLSGEDDGKFLIDDSTMAELTFVAPPDFEARGSAGGDNVYEVTVKAASTQSRCDGEEHDSGRDGGGDQR